MFTKTLLPDTLRAIKLVSIIPTVNRAYLAGGTALALQLGHRISVDLDFFTQEQINESLVATELSQLTKFNEDQRSWGTVLGMIGETKFSIFYYPYKLIDKLLPFEGIQLIGKKDIAAMKLHAISDRGVKRDFIDMYLLAQEFSMDEVFDFYDQKYGLTKERTYLILKSLDYFVSADNNAMPRMLVDVDWEKVKDFFRKETPRLAKKNLGEDL